VIRSRGTKSGYTLLELLVVIVIASLLVGIAIPAFRGILASSRRSLAESKLQQAIYAARDAATASIGGGDAAAVFFFEPGQGVRVLTCIEVGSLVDEPSGFSVGGTGSGNGPQRFDVFVPVSGYEPVQLPSSIGVRGFALGTTIDNGWYTNAADAGLLEPGLWLFPETAFYPAQRLNVRSLRRQSFLVRFTAGEGTLSRDPTRALVLSPSVGSGRNVSDAEGLLEADDLELWARRFLTRVDQTNAGGLEQRRREVLGIDSVHTVLAGPVAELALYEERELARAVGARGLNQETDSLYAPRSNRPVLDDALFQGNANQPAVEVLASKWLEGRIDPAEDGVPNVGDAQARIFAINAFFGDLVEITR
jgi:prepilin-type N-terminal cleavage/methylation domain-containing protein